MVYAERTTFAITRVESEPFNKRIWAWTYCSAVNKFLKDVEKVYFRDLRNGLECDWTPEEETIKFEELMFGAVTSLLDESDKPAILSITTNFPGPVTNNCLIISRKWVATELIPTILKGDAISIVKPASSCYFKFLWAAVPFAQGQVEGEAAAREDESAFLV